MRWTDPTTGDDQQLEAGLLSDHWQRDSGSSGLDLALAFSEQALEFWIAVQASKVRIASSPLQSLEAGLLGLLEHCKRFYFSFEESVNTRSVIQGGRIFGPQRNGYLQFPNCLSLLLEKTVAVGEQHSCTNVFRNQFELPLQGLKKLVSEAQRPLGLP